MAGLTESSQRRALVLLALVLPWLNPWTSGPSPEVLPWLVALACLAAALGVMPQGRTAWATPVALAWLLAVLLSSAMGLLQYFGVSTKLSPWVNLASLGEAYANLRQRNQFASLTNIGLLAVLWWAAQAQSVTKNRVWTTGLMLSTVLLALGNAASSSRTGLVQLGLIVSLAWWWHRQAPRTFTPLIRRLLLTAVGSYLLAALVLPVLVGQAVGGGIFARLQDGGPACSSRMVLWSNVLQLIAQKPGLGWGWGELRYAHFMTLYDGPRFCEIMEN